MEVFEYVPPSDAEISAAQKKLDMHFSPEYVDFIKSGYDLGCSVLEALEIDNPGSHVDIFEAIESARKYYGLPENLLPICEDNSDYYCLNEKGEVVFWSYNGVTDEMWSSIEAWRTQMISDASD